MSATSFLLAGLTFALTSSACSLLLHDDATQCHANGDCARFPGTLCDQGQGICVTGFLAGAGGRSAGEAAAARMWETGAPRRCRPRGDTVA